MRSVKLLKIMKLLRKIKDNWKKSSPRSKLNKVLNTIAISSVPIGYTVGRVKGERKELSPAEDYRKKLNKHNNYVIEDGEGRIKYLENLTEKERRAEYDFDPDNADEYIKADIEQQRKLIERHKKTSKDISEMSESELKKEERLENISNSKEVGVVAGVATGIGALLAKKYPRAIFGGVTGGVLGNVKGEIELNRLKKSDTYKKATPEEREKLLISAKDKKSLTSLKGAATGTILLPLVNKSLKTFSTKPRVIKSTRSLRADSLKAAKDKRISESNTIGKDLGNSIGKDLVSFSGIPRFLI